VAGQGDPITIDSQCNPTDCQNFIDAQTASGLTGVTMTGALDFNGCTIGTGLACFPSTAARDACFAMQTTVAPSVTLSADAQRILCTISSGGGSSGGGGSSSGSGNDNPCFPSSATVTMADGTTSRIDALKAGDAIIATTIDGTLTTDTVSPLSIAYPTAGEDYF
jgi:hypothetical protein